MKKNILISIYNMEIGGIERSLINMLESFDYEKYQVDLFIAHHNGDFMRMIPKHVTILPEISAYTIFRKSIKQSISEGHYYSSIVRLVSKSIANLRAKSCSTRRGFCIYSNAASNEIFVISFA